MGPGDAIDGKYQITRQLGEGGMGAVYEARHLGTGRRVAVKVIIGEALQKNAGMIARFQREARAAGAIESRHIAQVLDTGVDVKSGHPYLVMEFLQGQDVQQAIQKLGPLRPELALRIVAQACVGLQKAHEAGVTHRDLKPANIFLTVQDGGEILVKLLDFGIAKVRAEQINSAENASLTRTGAMLGSPLYMSPEQAKGAKNVDHRTDIWSLGIVLYEALTGTTPYGHCDTIGALFIAIASERPRPVQELSSWVSPEVAAIVHRAVAHDLNIRFSSAAEMLAAIRAVLPNGTSLDESMLMPLTPQAQAMVAQRLPLPAGPAASIPDLASGQLPFSGGPAAGPVTTAGGMATSQVRPPASRNAAVPLILGGLLVLGGGGYAAYRFSTHHAPAAASALAAPAPPPLASAALPSAAPPAAPAPTIVQLLVTPPSASVEIDGTAAPVASGHVDVTGLLGSTHHVRVFQGKKETLADVVIASSGPVPASIDLGAKPAVVAPGAPAAGPPGPAGPKNVPAGQPPAPVAAAPAAPPTPAPAPAPPKPTATGGVDRDFH